MKITNSSLLLILVITAVAFLAGCAEFQTDNTKSLLSAAGFQVRTPETAKQKAVYASVPNNRIERAKVNGKVFYVYKDEKAGVAYIGREREHQRYKQLCAQKHLAAKPEETMTRSAAANSYKYWGVGATLF